MNTISSYGLSEDYLELAGRTPEFTLARVIAQHKGLFTIATARGEYYAKPSGKLLRDTASALALHPAVGDYVLVTVADTEDQAVIQSVLPRKSAFARAAVGVTGQAQIVAANVDLVFLCMSLNQNFNLSRMERYLAAAWESGAQPVVLLTKSDLCEDLDAALKAIDGIALGAKVIVTTALDAHSADAVRAMIPSGVTASFLGSSGVGKSTLINLLLGENALVTADTGRNDKGRHTTTGREILPLPGGGAVIDTPGMRELGMVEADLESAFSDIEELSHQCKFNDCRHQREPGCAIQTALREGSLDARRWENYCKIKREKKPSLGNARLNEKAKYDAMFANVGGIKGMKKLMRQQHQGKRT